MKFKVKLFSVGGIPASDGSIIPRHVIEEYLASDKYREDIEGHKMLGSLTHRVRNWATQTKYNPIISKTAGKDDQMLCVDVAAPTHYINEVWIDSDQWVYAYATILEEDGMDDLAIQNIRRLKGMLNQNIKVGVSAVILGYWNNDSGHDALAKMVNLKGFDVTLNPSWKDAGVTEIIKDNEPAIAPSKRIVYAKTFSSTEEFGDYLKTSKVNNQYTVLKAKEFSFTCELGTENEVQKVFSSATIKERVRYAKFSPRMRFRRLFIDYKQLIKQMGGLGKIDPETLKTLKSLFATDVLDILKSLSTDIKEGKQITTLIGAGSLGKSVRVASQKLQMPYRYAMQEATSRGSLSPNRYKNLQAAYLEFINSMTDEVFGPSPIPDGLVEDANKEEEVIK